MQITVFNFSPTALTPEEIAEIGLLFPQPERPAGAVETDPDPVNPVEDVEIPAKLEGTGLIDQARPFVRKIPRLAAVDKYLLHLPTDVGQAFALAAAFELENKTGQYNADVLIKNGAGKFEIIPLASL